MITSASFGETPDTPIKAASSSSFIFWYGLNQRADGRVLDREGTFRA
jgi:hypothetical protein